MNSSMLTVVYLSTMQHKLVLLLWDNIFRVSLSESVITQDKGNWLLIETYCESKNFNIISYYILHFNSQAITAQKYVSV